MLIRLFFNASPSRIESPVCGAMRFVKTLSLVALGGLASGMAHDQAFAADPSLRKLDDVVKQAQRSNQARSATKSNRSNIQLMAGEEPAASVPAGIGTQPFATTEPDDALEARKARYQYGYSGPSRSSRRIDLRGDNVQRMLVRARLELASGDTYAAHKYAETAAQTPIPFEIFKVRPYAVLTEIERANEQGRAVQTNFLARPEPQLPVQEFNIQPPTLTEPAPFVPPADEPEPEPLVVVETISPEVTIEPEPMLPPKLEYIAPIPLPEPKLAYQPRENLPGAETKGDRLTDRLKRSPRGYQAIGEQSLSVLPPNTDKDGQQTQLPEPQARKRLEQIPVEPHPLGTGRKWTDQVFAWEAPAFYYSPLYFEDEQLERYGNEIPLVQPLVSGTHFLLTIPTLPYQMGIEGNGPCAEIYDLGHDRPGDCVRYSWQRLPWSWTGALVEGATATGLIFIVP